MQNAPSEEPLGRFGRWPSILAIVLLLAGLGFGAQSTLRYWASVAAFPGEIDYAEGVILIEATRSNRGEEVYPPSFQNRFIGTIYGPVLYAIVNTAARLAPDSFAPLRIVSLIAALLLTFFVGAAIFAVTRDYLAALVGALLALHIQSFIIFGASGKPDSLYMCFSFGGLAAALRFRDSPAFYLSAVLFALGLLVKASAVAAPAAVFLNLVLSRQWRQAAIFVTAGVVTCLLVVGLYAVEVPIATLFVHMFYYNKAEFDFWASLLDRTPVFYSKTTLFIWLAILLWKWIPERRLLTAYFLLAAAFHVPLAGKAGGFINYFTEPGLALCLIIGVGYGAVRERGAPRWVAWGATACLIVLAPFYYRTYKQSPPGRAERAAARAQHARISSLLEGRRSQVLLASSPGVIARFESRADIPVSDTFLYNQLVIFGVIRDELVSRGLAQKRFDYVFLTDYANIRTKRSHQLRCTLTQLDLVERNYRISEVLPGTRFSEGDVSVFVRK